MINKLQASDLKKLSREELQQTLEHAFLTIGLLKEARDNERLKIKALLADLERARKHRYALGLILFASLILLLWRW